MKWLRTPDPDRTRIDPDHVFRALYSFSAVSRGALVFLGIASIAVTSVIEWATELPVPDDVVFVLIIGAVAFHGGGPAGFSLALLAGLGRFISVGAPAARAPADWPMAALEGIALFLLLLGIVVLATALHRAIGALQHQALRDPLTGTLNSRGFMDLAERERLRSIRDDSPLTITYFDLDGLKEINDTSGHQAGDQLLLRFVSAVAASIRPYDIFARVGGDEFVVVLPDTGPRAALGVVTRIHTQLKSRIPPLSVSVGAVTYTGPPDPVESMLQAADRLMYQAKRAGGNRLVGETRSGEPGTNTQVVELDDLVGQV